MSGPAVIRNCYDLAEFYACVALQREIWGEEPLEVEPATMFVVAAHTGGQVIGAFDGDELVGFVLAVAGVRDGRAYLHSHMAGVREGYRNQGLGRKLKLFQREDALGRGITLIEWTFDPLEVRNAHFNLNRLGAICRTYLPNLYGVTTSPLHRGLRTDRLLAEWHLQSPSVVARIDGAQGAAVPQNLGERDGVPKQDANLKIRHYRGTGAGGEQGPWAYILVPAVPYGVGGDVSAVAAVQDRLYEEFTNWFGKGYVVVAVQPGTESAYALVGAK
ncbi:MAG: GNAT family N-acetyltransferase [Candidatus Acidiferrum sp.]|jgi:predicted GNAT superfamily acetyltransferase